MIQLYTIKTMIKIYKSNFTNTKKNFRRKIFRNIQENIFNSFLTVQQIFQPSTSFF